MQENISLKPFNTFGLDFPARFFVSIENLDTLYSVQADKKYKDLPKLVLGGGSNVVFTQPYEGLILHNRLLGKEVIGEDNEHYYLRVAAGENWHELVTESVAQGMYGLENLALIPGTVGAAPIQNIGAYGVELKTLFYELEAINLLTGALENFSPLRCQFGYRDSIFKKEGSKGLYFITSVTLKLLKKPHINIEYQDLQKRLATTADTVTPQVVYEAVCQIRQDKLPDPKVIGNVGSFFKNPIVSIDKFKRLKDQYPRLVGHLHENNSVKLAAAWLIEYCGWKGQCMGKIGIHPKQALVIVNYGDGPVENILHIAKAIKEHVYREFGVKLEEEPLVL